MRRILYASVALLALTGWMIMERPKAFIPTEDQGYLIVVVQTPDGTSGERRRLEVAQGRALVMSGAIVEGQERLEKTLEELNATEPPDTKLALAARAELAACGLDGPRRQR